ALARALACRPQVLLLDEPFAALNPMLRAELREELAEVRRAWGIPVLMITHDIEDVLALADVAFVYKDGQVVREIDLHTAESREISLREAAGVPAVEDTPLRSKLRGLLMQDAPGA
ncbi:ABC transporter ATP-binding protein, partial [Variovorax sp. CT11-76]